MNKENERKQPAYVLSFSFCRSSHLTMAHRSECVRFCCDEYNRVRERKRERGRVRMNKKIERRVSKLMTKRKQSKGKEEEATNKTTMKMIETTTMMRMMMLMNIASKNPTEHNSSYIFQTQRLKNHHHTAKM